jgi:UDP-3-O-[3-hydroxymyristoyl] glucosamine N-acyltransferase
MQFNAVQIAQLINGKIEGDEKVAVSSFGKIETAQPGQLAFLANPKYEEHLYTTSASIIIINDAQELRQKLNATLIRVTDAYTAFATILDSYQQIVTEQLNGIQQPVYLAATAKLGDNIFIGAFSYIGENVTISENVKIFPQVFLGDGVIVGANTILYPGVKIYHDCVLGKNVTIHAGTVIGSDGFGFAPQKDGTFKKVPQIGNVVIEDNVEIGANTTIDRATLGSTIIKKGVKLDNLIQIAHNVEIGYNTVIAAQAGISGSTKIGSNVMVAGQVGMAGHISVADGSKIAGQSGITKSIKNVNSVVTGTPAQDHGTALRALVHNRKIPDLEKKLHELEKLVTQLLSEREIKI